MFKKGEFHGQRGRKAGIPNRWTFDLLQCLQSRFPATEKTRLAWVGDLSQAKSSPGRDHYKKYVCGDRISLRQAVTAQCADCCGFYADGKDDCENPLCPLYPWMPYRIKNDTKPKQNDFGGVAQSHAGEGTW